MYAYAGVHVGTDEDEERRNKARVKRENPKHGEDTAKIE